MHRHKGRRICQVAIHVAISGGELLRIPKRRSSQNFSSPTLGEKGPVGREDGISVPDRVMASIVHGRGPLVL